MSDIYCQVIAALRYGIQVKKRVHHAVYIYSKDFAPRPNLKYFLCSRFVYYVFFFQIVATETILYVRLRVRYFNSTLPCEKNIVTVFPDNCHFNSINFFYSKVFF